MHGKKCNIAFFCEEIKKIWGKTIDFYRGSLYDKRVWMIFIVHCLHRSTRQEEKGMLNYEEELLKFQPSLEIDEAEEAIMNNDLTDLSDLLEQVTTGKKEKR